VAHRLIAKARTHLRRRLQSVHRSSRGGRRWKSCRAPLAESTSELRGTRRSDLGAGPGRRASTRGLIAALTWSLCAGVACNWPWRHDMVDAPSRPASAGPRSAPPGTMPIDGELRRATDAAADLINPIDASASDAPGRAMYGVYCAPCHGMSGKGDGPVAKYYPSAGDLTRSDVQQRSDGWLYLVIVDGTEKMPSYAHELTRTERWQVVRFVRTLASPVP